MLLIVGSSLYEEPWQLAQHWVDRSVAVLTPADLSRSGWVFRTSQPGTGRFVAGGVTSNESDLEGVVATLPWVSVFDLPHILPTEREYVAAEMSAFLLAWLARLRCPLIDVASPSCLCGCGRTIWEWRSLARAIGIDTVDSAASDGVGRTVAVTVIDGQVSAPTPSATALAARRLAGAAGRRLVTLRFTLGDPPAFVRAEPVPAVGSIDVADRLLDWFQAVG